MGATIIATSFPGYGRICDFIWLIQYRLTFLSCSRISKIKESMKGVISMKKNLIFLDIALLIDPCALGIRPESKSEMCAILTTNSIIGFTSSPVCVSWLLISGLKSPNSFLYQVRQAYPEVPFLVSPVSWFLWQSDRFLSLNQSQPAWPHDFYMFHSFKPIHRLGQKSEGDMISDE